MHSGSLRAGMAVRLGGEIYKVLAASYVPGACNLAGLSHATLCNLRTGTFRELSFRADEPVEQVELEQRSLKFLHRDFGLSYFLDPVGFEQVVIEEERLGTAGAFLGNGMVVPVQFFEGRPVGVVLPDVLEATVSETAPRSHTQGPWKEARLETGATILVPPFIAPGERIRVDVHAARYLERAKGTKG